jgi:signal transduction histidine kinase
MFSRIWYYRKSLLVQLAILSIAVFVLIFVQFLIVPYWKDSDDKEDAFFTRSVIYNIIHEIIESEDKDFEKIRNNKDFQKVLKVNPELRYFIETEKRRVTFGGEPRRINFPKKTYILKTKKNGGYPCSYYSNTDLPFMENGVISMAHFNNCPGEAHYIEIAGIKTSAFTRVEIMWGYLKQLHVIFFEEQLMLGGGILLIGFFIIFQVIYSFRKMAIIAKKYDLGKGHINLSEKGLPVEVRPLVRAFNEMLVRVEESHEKQNFFLATAAHELRTPLTIIRTRIEELPQSALKEDVRSDIRRISKLVEQLLRLAKLKSIDDLDHRSVDLVDIARKVCASRAPLAIGRDVEMELKSDQDHVVIGGNKEMVSTAIANLVDNALSVSKKGDALIVEVTSSGAILVKDNGPGVLEERREEIFEPFAKNPPNRSGHGLGLAIVKAVMNLHKGSVDQKNNAGGGSIFTLHFNVSAFVQSAE